MIYVTSFNPLNYRRPIFAKKALPHLRIYYLSSYRRAGIASYILSKLYSKIIRVEAHICKKSRSGVDYYISALLRDCLTSIEFKGLKENTIIALNPYLASRILWGYKCRVVLDWMDVWMTFNGEMNSFDIRAAREADGVIFWSKPLMKLITRRIPLKRSIYIPYGVDLSVFNPKRYGNQEYFRNKYGLRDRFVIFYSGGFWRTKDTDLQGTDKMLQAFSLVSRKLPQAVLVLQVLNLNQDILSIIKKFGFRVRILGSLPYASFLRQSAFAAADVLLAPNTRHPTGYYAERMKFFQYMAAGKAIIAEETPGALSALGDAAYYVKLGDIEGMADAIVEIACNREFREELGARAQMRALAFEWSKLAQIYRRFVEELSS
ncbi:MAG: glycosyltransferase family 4 protein [Thermofilum sp.]|nr:glycosyltransferase family 4 protein [Thermofilum sp.]